MRLWLDDKRPAPTGWTHATTAEEALAILVAEDVEFASFDHDLGDGPDGTHLVLAMASRNDAWPRFKPHVHSGNVHAADRMRQLIDDHGPYERRKGHRVVFEVPAGEAEFQVEVAETQIAQARGLRHRRMLPLSRGMLFVFDRERPQSFTMRDTLIPLDMIFVGGDRRVVDVIENAAPGTAGPYTSPRPARYVVELNAGLVRAWQIRPGTPMRIQRWVNGILQP